MCTIMSTDEAVMETYRSSVYTEFKSYFAKHSPSTANMAVETPHTAEGQLSMLETLLERKKRKREMMSIKRQVW